MLLVRHTYDRREAWYPPGGWVGRGETPRQAAARETCEELGLRVLVGRVLAVGTGGYGEIILLFEGRLVDDQAPGPSEEIASAAYFPTTDLPPLSAQTRDWLEEAFNAQRPGR